jgi:hypothetical protein
MSSLAAETVMDLDLKKNTPNSSSLPFPSSSHTMSHTMKSPDVQDLKNPSYGFDESYATIAGPSSAGLEEQGFFTDLPVLEKGNQLDSTSIPPLTPFVLDESYIRQREGGWAGWTCVAGSWLVCTFLPLGLVGSTEDLVFATAGYANAFGVCYDMGSYEGKLT